MLTVHHTLELKSPQSDIEPTGATVRLPCRRCFGNRIIRLHVSSTPYGSEYNEIECPNCAGTGYVDAVVRVEYLPAKFELKTSKI